MSLDDLFDEPTLEARLTGASTRLVALLDPAAPLEMPSQLSPMAMPMPMQMRSRTPTRSLVQPAQRPLRRSCTFLRPRTVNPVAPGSCWVRRPLPRWW